MCVYDRPFRPMPARSHIPILKRCVPAGGAASAVSTFIECMNRLMCPRFADYLCFFFLFLFLFFLVCHSLWFSISLTSDVLFLLVCFFLATLLSRFTNPQLKMRYFVLTENRTFCCSVFRSVPVFFSLGFSFN